jgi:hypothetical protein
MPAEIEEQIACPRSERDDNREVQDRAEVAAMKSVTHIPTLGLLQFRAQREGVLRGGREWSWQCATLGTPTVPRRSIVQSHLSGGPEWTFLERPGTYVTSQFLHDFSGHFLDLRQPFRFVTINPQLRRDSSYRAMPNSGGVPATCPT